jgi:Predicted nucleoside-diphosphate-sugar epimerase
MNTDALRTIDMLACGQASRMVFALAAPMPLASALSSFFGPVQAMTTPNHTSHPPRTWLLIGDKLGDNAQVDVLAGALGWPCETKRLQFLPQYVKGKPSFRPSLYHIDQASSDPLQPPWPDLILTIGRRPSMAALWVKEQAAGRPRVVLIGRPRRLWERFDLVIASSQYRLPERANLIRLALPLLRVDETAIATAAESWSGRMASLPRPLTAVLVGGPTGDFIFDASVTRDFLAAIDRTTGGAGTLFATTSRRTPDDVDAALERYLPPSAILYRWRAGDPDNPYKALLGLADQFVVTGDSVSMLVEVARLGKPLAIFPLPEKASVWPRSRRWLASLLQPAADQNTPSTALASLGDRLFDRGIVLFSREFEYLYRTLRERRLATMLGEPFPVSHDAAPDELPEVAARIRRLMEKQGIQRI